LVSEMCFLQITNGPVLLFDPIHYSMPFDWRVELRPLTFSVNTERYVVVFATLLFLWCLILFYSSFVYILIW
jgi:hypothetical protein